MCHVLLRCRESRRMVAGKSFVGVSNRGIRSSRTQKIAACGIHEPVYAEYEVVRHKQERPCCLPTHVPRMAAAITVQNNSRDYLSLSVGIRNGESLSGSHRS